MNFHPAATLRSAPTRHDRPPTGGAQGFCAPGHRDDSALEDLHCIPILYDEDFFTTPYPDYCWVAEEHYRTENREHMGWARVHCVSVIQFLHAVGLS